MSKEAPIENCQPQPVVRSMAEENIPPETNPCARQDPADEAKVAAAASKPDVSGEMPGTWEAYPTAL
jgi:hypothetical protein